LRPKEAGKIKCGKRHFNAIGSKMIVATELADVEDYALSK
jgi:type III restriction enzyme